MRLEDFSMPPPPEKKKEEIKREKGLLMRATTLWLLRSISLSNS